MLRIISLKWENSRRVGCRLEKDGQEFGVAADVDDEKETIRGVLYHEVPKELKKYMYTSNEGIEFGRYLWRFIYGKKIPKFPFVVGERK